LHQEIRAELRDLGADGADFEEGSDDEDDDEDFDDDDGDDYLVAEDDMQDDDSDMDDTDEDDDYDDFDAHGVPAQAAIEELSGDDDGAVSVPNEDSEAAPVAPEENCGRSGDPATEIRSYPITAFDEEDDAI
jgi:hypothetical protein